MNIILDIVEEHIEEAAFLWEQRETALSGPDFDLFDLAEWEERLEAHLEGLNVAGESGWKISRDLGWEAGGEYFTAASLALKQGNLKWFEEVLESVEDNPDFGYALISALGWAEAPQLKGLVKSMLDHNSPLRRFIGIGACAVQRRNPGAQLRDALSDESSFLRARALKAVGELGVVELREEVEKSLDHPDQACSFWAAWSSALIGRKESREILASFASTNNSFQRPALVLHMLSLGSEDGKRWLRGMLSNSDQLRWSIIGAGIQGDAFYLEPLMRRFEDEEMARVAGEAFELITGLDIFYESLEVIPEQDQSEHQPPSNEEEEEDGKFLDQADDEEDDYQDLGQDEDLVVPDPAKMNDWWDRNKNGFQVGQRYLLGKELGNDAYKNALQHGRQRQRECAALSLALTNPDSPLFPTRDRAKRQLAKLQDR